MLFVDSILNPIKQATTTVVLLTASFVADIFALIASKITALVAVVWFVSLCVEALGEPCTHSAVLYTQSDPAVKLVILVLIASTTVKLLHLDRR